MANLLDTGNTVKVVAATYTATANDSDIFVEVPTANVTITLPSATALDGATSAQGLANVGRSITVTKDATATFTVTIAAAGGSVLGGTNPMVASAVHSSTWTCDGTNWYCTSYV
jgi:hypothetical protein